MNDLIERLEAIKAFAPNECRAVIDEAIQELRRLEDRLELYPVDLDGNEVRDMRLDEFCDGIACRDATIELLESRIEELEYACKNNAEYIKELDDARKDGLAKIEKLERVREQADLYLYCSRTYGAQAKETINSGNQLAEALAEVDDD